MPNHATTARILIVEDNPLTAEALRAVLEDEGYTVAGRLRRGDDLANWLDENDADLLLMDIHLEGQMDGIEAVANLNQHLRRPLIFLSAFEDKALLERAFATQPAGYLTKPYKNIDLLNAVRAALAAAALLNPPATAATWEDAPPVPNHDFIFIKAGKRFEKVKYEEMLWLRADGSYTEMVTQHGKYVFVMPLGTMLERFQHPHLRRVHRSYAVNLMAVTAFDDSVIFINETAIPFSKAYQREIREFLPIM